MAVTSQPTNPHHLSPGSSNGMATPRSPGVRPTLPHKSVTSDNIEDAYVNFILYCNPAVALDVDTANLREAFRNPPKSEGKSFSTFALFELIAKLHQKEIKTWAELALKLGVEPPDQDKGQSSQKIQQYAVRLKRWMHSMHVNAFFDYLLDNPHPYWTQVPTNPNPVCEEGRDGVAAEDDMALRALLPHIRPRRGRKRPEDDNLNKSPSQRPKLDSPSFNGDVRQTARQDTIEPWTAHPDGGRAFIFPPVDPRVSSLTTYEPASPWQNDAVREPMSAYPQSAITPATRGAFWGDTAEPRSAITPSKNRTLNRRHGAKAVSSAWRSTGVPANGKARGRPPLNRVSETPLSAYPDDRRAFEPCPLEQTPHPTSAPIQMYPPPLPPSTSASVHPSSEPTSASSTRPSRPGGLTLQVPERASGPVRLATPPPPVVMINGKDATDGREPTNGIFASSNTGPGTDAEAFTMFDRTSAMYRNPGDPGPAEKMFVDGPDRTNIAEVESIFVATILDSDWFNTNGEPCPVGPIEEVVALVQNIIRGIADQALTKESFLINLSALAGGTFLLKNGRTTRRLEIGADYTKYLCKWTLRYGPVVGDFELTETVPHSRWKPGYQKRTEPPTPGDIPPEGEAAVEYWRKKYRELAALTNKKIRNLAEIRNHVAQITKNMNEGEFIHRPAR
ncbi:ARS binding protein 2-domain-containing protein [Xylariaceae sp. FL0016]|nr:ARS binding protein 2-domain-containing protein [Xylariaceae sp. FL0016]